MIKVNPKGISHIKGIDGFCLGVSMGSLNHEDERLGAIIEWINKFGFTHGIVDVSDALYRHTYISQGFSQANAMAKSVQDGDNWLERNRSILNRIKPSVQIIRWSHWLQNPEFYQYMKYFLSLYEKDENFRNAIDGDIEHFHARKYGTSIKTLRPSAHAQSVNYFCEELSVHSILLSQYPLVTVYPGKQLDSYKLIRKGVVPGATDGIKNSPYVRLCLYDGYADSDNLLVQTA